MKFVLLNKLSIVITVFLVDWGLEDLHLLQVRGGA